MVVARWALLDLVNTPTATGVETVITTDVPCHLWLRWTIEPPRIHSKPILVRGLRTRDDVRFCFTVFFDIEQDEAGDTYTHTFQQTPWPACTIRYFYFHGTIGGVTSPSTTGIFSYHRVQPPIVETFYPDAHPEISSVDGHVARLAPFQTWSQTRNGPGDDHSDFSPAMTVKLRVSGAAPPNYYSTHRIIITFDLSSAIGTTASLARLEVYMTVKFDNEGINPAIGIFKTYPLAMNDLVNSDFQRFLVPLLAARKNYNDLPAAGWLSFPFMAAGLAHIQSALDTDGKLKIGIREGNYDAPDVEPYAGIRSRQCYFLFRTADYSLAYSPRLILTHT